VVISNQNFHQVIKKISLQDNHFLSAKKQDKVLDKQILIFSFR
jgi:hypothetical protein